MSGFRKKPWPAWMRDGVLMVGNWEPLMFRRRAGTARLQEVTIYREEHAAKTIERLADLGVNLIVTHFHKGFGTPLEQDEMETTRRLIQDAHRLHMQVGVYVRFDAVVSETYFVHTPQALNWVQRNARGETPTYDGQDFRPRMCPNQEPYVDTVVALVDLAVGDFGADLMHFDGFGWGTDEPCHCEACRVQFQEFLAQQYPQEEDREARFGHRYLDRIKLPSKPLEGWPIAVRDPVQQEWLRFRCKTMERVQARLVDTARQYGDHVAIALNTHIPTYFNGAIETGTSLYRLSVYNDAAWTEGKNNPRMDDDGRIISRVREYKFAEASENVAFVQLGGSSSEDFRRMFAEVLAFNGGHAASLGSPLVDSSPFIAEIQRWTAFYRRYHALVYSATTSAAEVAVLRHEPTLTWNSGKPYLSVHLFEQLLLEHHIPYRTIFSRHLSQLGLVKTVILADVECLSEQEAEQIQSFVAEGGSLVVTGQTGLYDLEYRRYPDYLLRDLLGDTIALPQDVFWASYESSRLESPSQAGTRPAFRRYGQGRVVYARDLLPSAAGQWKAPLREFDWAAAVRWTLGESATEIWAPREVFVEVRRATGSTLDWRIHLVHYGSKLVEAGVVFQLRVSPSDSASLKGKTLHAVMYNPDREEPKTLDLHVDIETGTMEVCVPPFLSYAAVVVGETFSSQC